MCVLKFFDLCGYPPGGHQPVDKLDDLDAVDLLFIGLAVHRAAIEAIWV